MLPSRLFASNPRAAALVLAPFLGACVGSGVDVPENHPASARASSAPLPGVAAMLSSDEPTAAAPAADPHAHHHHHHGGGE